MRDILYYWRESGGGGYGPPLEWWSAMGREEKAFIRADGRLRVKEAQRG